mgnify:CR=1 FL=1
MNETQSKRRIIFFVRTSFKPDPGIANNIVGDIVFSLPQIILRRINDYIDKRGIYQRHTLMGCQQNMTKIFPKN